MVLFQKASRTEEMNIPKATDLSADTCHDTADGPEREYTVIERVPPPEPEPEKLSTPRFIDQSAMDWAEVTRDYDNREITLKVDAEGIKVHIVKAVSFKTDEHTVKRYRWAKLDAKDEPF